MDRRRTVALGRCAHALTQARGARCAPAAPNQAAARCHTDAGCAIAAVGDGIASDHLAMAAVVAGGAALVAFAWAWSRDHHPAS